MEPRQPIHDMMVASAAAHARNSSRDSLPSWFWSAYEKAEFTKSSMASVNSACVRAGAVAEGVSSCVAEGVSSCVAVVVVAGVSLCGMGAVNMAEIGFPCSSLNLSICSEAVSGSGDCGYRY